MLQRKTAFKVQAGDILTGTPVFDGDRFTELSTGGKKVSRVNVLGNIIDKYSNEEKTFCALTIDDGSGQVKIKGFSDQFSLITDQNIGDTVCVIGMLRHYNEEVYVTPEIIKVVDSKWLNVRRLELGIPAEAPKISDTPKPMEVNPPIPEPAPVPKQETPKKVPTVEEMLAQSSSTQQPETKMEIVTEKVESVPSEKLKSPKLQALGLIRKNKEMEIKTLASEMGKQESDLNQVINDLITEGEIYELKPGYLCSVN